MNRALELLAKFQARFGTSAVVYRAPGRVNLIGEHTDYNDGFVLPAAIGLSCWVAIAPRKDRKLVLFSENFAELIEADLDKLPLRGCDRWADYPLGVAMTLEQAGNCLRGANLYISGEIPLGAGLSSSAALEVSVGYALLHVAHSRLTAPSSHYFASSRKTNLLGRDAASWISSSPATGARAMRSCSIAGPSTTAFFACRLICNWSFATPWSSMNWGLANTTHAARSVKKPCAVLPGFCPGSRHCEMCYARTTRRTPPSAYGHPLQEMPPRPHGERSCPRSCAGI